MRLFFLIIAAAIVAVCCSPSERQGKAAATLHYWHFWSEPAQKAVLQKQIAAFEAQRPDINIELTDLNWSDGKSKLQLAFNSGRAPDVVQLGFEWTPEFAEAGVLQALPDSLLASRSNILPAALKALSLHSTLYALPWTVNTRALLLRGAHDTVRSWDDLKTAVEAAHRPEVSYGFGVNASEPHNVLKKALPFMWSAGSAIFTATPLAQSFDQAAVRGLTYYRSLAQSGIPERSRRLDELFLQGTVGAWITGAWILDMVENHQRSSSFSVLPQIPTASPRDTGWSILGGDCLAVSGSSRFTTEAMDFISFLTDYRQARSFCLAVSDAGIPADTNALSDEAFRQTAGQRGFLEQLRYARTLPWSPVFLEAESILEEAIGKAVYGELTAADALNQARARISELEQKQ